MSDISPHFAFVTLVTSDDYLPGALVVAAALRELHPSPPSCTGEPDPRAFHILCLVTPETVNVQTLKILRKNFDVVIGVEVIEADTEENLDLLGRPDLKTVLTKLHAFRLNSYLKIIFLDADVLPLLPLSHLFHDVHSFSAVSDVGWPDIFNSGVLVFKPGEDDFEQLMRIVRSQGSWDGGDQGVLNEWRGSDWNRLSFTYNTTPTGAYTYAPAYKRFGSDIKAIHFIGRQKPWSEKPLRAPTPTDCSSRSSETLLDGNASYAYPALQDMWFAVFDKHYRSSFPLFTATGSLMPMETFSEGSYKNVWDSSFSDLSTGNPPFGLDKLKQLALQGNGQIPTSGPGEGAYMTLPLEGRLDLMPFKRSHFRKLLVHRPIQSNVSTDLSDSLHVDTLYDLPGSVSNDFPAGKMDEEVSDFNIVSKSLSLSCSSSDSSAQWDPWTNPYPNAWDLYPGIAQRYLKHSVFAERRYHSSADTLVTKEKSAGSDRKWNWEYKIESTSADGDDEAEDEIVRSRSNSNSNTGSKARRNFIR